MRVVICGGGVIGACTAYFLARRRIDVTVVERLEVASCASGKAGGFLARDWCAGSALDALARRSFALHASLHEEIGSWSYQRVSAYSGLVVPDADKRRHAAAKLNWLSDGVLIGAQLSTPETTAMVNPHAAAAWRGYRPRPPRRCGRGRRGWRRDDRGRRGRHCAGTVVAARRTVAAPAAGVRAAKPKPRLRHRHGRAGRGALPRLARG
jgi:FAD dependent oxidoreductase